MTQPFALKVVQQREEGDCVIAALATYTNRTYEEVLRAAVQVDPCYDGVCGITVPNIKRIAEVLGDPLSKKRKVDLDDDFGIIVVSDHVAVLWNGLIFDPNGTVWEADDYLQRYKETPLALLY